MGHWESHRTEHTHGLEDKNSFQGALQLEEPMILPPLSNIIGGKEYLGESGGRKEGARVQEVGLTSSTQELLLLPYLGQSWLSGFHRPSLTLGVPESPHGRGYRIPTGYNASWAEAVFAVTIYGRMREG